MEKGAESMMAKISEGDCAVFPPDDIWRYFCEEFIKLEERQNDLETHLYITAGVIGGVSLILLILIIVLFVKLNQMFKGMSDGDDLEKRGFSTYTGNPTSPFAQSPPTIPMTGGGTQFENGTAGGVRVLPRNPPILRPNNPNEKYY